MAGPRPLERVLYEIVPIALVVGGLIWLARRTGEVREVAQLGGTVTRSRADYPTIPASAWRAPAAVQTRLRQGLAWHRRGHSGRGHSRGRSGRVHSRGWGHSWVHSGLGAWATVGATAGSTVAVATAGETRWTQSAHRRRWLAGGCRRLRGGREAARNESWGHAWESQRTR